MSCLLEQAVHTALISSLEQGGDGKGSNGAVLIRYEALHVNIAVGDGHGVCHGHLVQCTHCSKSAPDQTRLSCTADIEWRMSQQIQPED